MTERDPLADAVDEAGERVYRHAVVTPLLRAVGEGAAAVDLKLECLQVTGSFKVRGAANKLELAAGRDRPAGVVACSSGNHGRAVAHVARRLHLPAVIFVPTWTDPAKLAGMRRDGADVRVAGETYDAAEAQALEFAAGAGLMFAHPFDDADVIGGQGTVGLELLRQLEGIDAVVVPLSGGGLVAGIAAAIKPRAPEVQIIAASAEGASVMYRTVTEAAQTSEEPTLADALAGGIGNPNRLTLSAVRRLVDRHVLVSESDIADAIRELWQRHRLVVEGGEAVAFAAIRAGAVPIDSAVRTVAIVSGSNMNLNRWRSVIGDDA